jgi:hypothetical protein
MEREKEPLRPLAQLGFVFTNAMTGIMWMLPTISVAHSSVLGLRTFQRQ